VTNHVPVKPGERSSRVFSWLIYEDDKLSSPCATFVRTRVSTMSRSCIEVHFETARQQLLSIDKRSISESASVR